MNERIRHTGQLAELNQAAYALMKDRTIQRILTTLNTLNQIDSAITVEESDDHRSVRLVYNLIYAKLYLDFSFNQDITQLEAGTAIQSSQEVSIGERTLVATLNLQVLEAGQREWSLSFIDSSFSYAQKLVEQNQEVFAVLKDWSLRDILQVLNNSCTDGKVGYEEGRDNKSLLVRVDFTDAVLYLDFSFTQDLTQLEVGTSTEYFQTITIGTHTIRAILYLKVLDNGQRKWSLVFTEK